MKLRNKKTGEVVDFHYLQTDYIAPLVLTIKISDKPEMYKYNSLAELNEEWEDYEETSKTIWQIKDSGELQDFEEDVFSDGYIESSKSIGNYFDTREEAEKAVEKLKAVKRLKDNGFRFEGWYYDREIIHNGKVNVIVKGNFYESYDIDAVKLSDLDLLFGGEE